LADALVEYEGTLIFTSHDRHFMKKVATSVIEVRDGRVVNYSGQYEAYLTKVNEEIEAGERETASERKKLPPEVVKRAPAVPRRNERDVRKELKALERTIAQLDEQRRAINDQLLKSTDSAEALRLHNEVQALTAPLAQAEERWCELQEQMESSE
jgi:ATP-binding cassette subfamily F protein 3